MGGAAVGAEGSTRIVVVADDHLHRVSRSTACRQLREHRQNRAADDPGTTQRRSTRCGHMPRRSAARRNLATRSLDRGWATGVDLALSWEAPVDHAFLSQVNTLSRLPALPPLCPYWVELLRGAQPTARRCFAFETSTWHGCCGRQPVELGPHREQEACSNFRTVAAAGGRGQTPVFDRKLIHWMEHGEVTSPCGARGDEMHKTAATSS